MFEGFTQTRTVIDLAWRIETLDDVGELTQHLRIKCIE